MFGIAHTFNQDIGNWNMSKATTMEFMFNDTLDFNQNIGDWDVSNVELRNDIFKNCPIQDANNPNF
tara:strand:- start:38 stop:235 length:198 start_codon:yes stop_codon:yes gene_type:complete